MQADRRDSPIYGVKMTTTTIMGTKVPQLDERRIATLTDAELIDYRDNVQIVIHDISEDMTAYEAGYLIQYDAEWYARARIARRFWKATAGLIKAEKRRRPTFAQIQNPGPDELEKSWRYNALRYAVAKLTTEEVRRAIFELSGEILEETKANYFSNGQRDPSDQEEPDVWTNQTP